MRDTLYLRGNIWWCRVRNPHGGRHVKASTGCRDRKAGVVRWRELERLAFAPADQATDPTTLGDALDDRLAERKSAGRAAGTLDMLKSKARHLTRVLGAETPLARVDAQCIDAFVTQRLKEGASRSTVQKELVTLRGALKLARRRRKYPYSLDQVMPEFSAKYRPRERALSLAEVSALRAALPAKRAALVGLIVATAATYPSELRTMRRGDVDLKAGFVRLRGTKRETRDRKVPVVDFARAWVAEALPYLPFEPWANIRRDSLLAGWWGRKWSLEEVQVVMGHSSITITQRYAHLSEDTIAQAARETSVEVPPETLPLVEVPPPLGFVRSVMSRVFGAIRRAS